MSLSAAGTFDYVAIVPEKSGATEFECRGSLTRSVIPRPGGDSDARLVGPAPLIQVTDAGLTPDAGPKRPWVMRSRITLRAPRRDRATCAEASFHVDKALLACSRAGDELHLTRSRCGGLALSILRDGELVVCAGAITRIPTGRTVQVSIPGDLVSRAEAMFRERDSEFRMRDKPVELCVGGALSILSAGRREFGEYLVFLVHGFLDGIPGTDPCGSIHRTGQCGDVPAEASALLMACEDALTVRRWSD